MEARKEEKLPDQLSWAQKLGPGLITGAADDDPSGIATYSQAGAQFGVGMLWTLVFTYPLMAGIQIVSARIGRVTGHGLATNIRRHYPAPLLYLIVGLLMLANTINIAADVAAMGDAARLVAGGPAHWYAVGFGLLSVLLQVFVPYSRYVRLLKWLTLALLAYVATVFVVHVPWMRDADGKRPASVKESERWVEGYERVAEQAAQLPDTRLVYVADREADMLGMIRRAHQLETPADWLVRAKHDRCLANGEGKRLWSETTADMPLGEISFVMAGRGKQKARQVRQQIWAKRVLLRDGKRGKIEATCILAREMAAPTGVKPVEWRLLTNRCAETLADASELIDWYRARWEIEIFFNVLKNGCEVEELQLSAMDRLERALALFMVVAWRIAYLMRKGRTCPDLDATLFFDPDEIRAAYLLNKKKPPTAPGMNEVLRMVARVGGFLARKHDGEPGVKTIWRGLQDVQVSAQTIRTLREMGALQD